MLMLLNSANHNPASCPWWVLIGNSKKSTQEALSTSAPAWPRPALRALGGCKVVVALLLAGCGGEALLPMPEDQANSPSSSPAAALPLPMFSSAIMLVGGQTGSESIGPCDQGSPVESDDARFDGQSANDGFAAINAQADVSLRWADGSRGPAQLTLEPSSDVLQVTPTSHEVEPGTCPRFTARTEAVLEIAGTERRWSVELNWFSDTRYFYQGVADLGEWEPLAAPDYDAAVTTVLAVERTEDAFDAALFQAQLESTRVLALIEREAP